MSDGPTAREHENVHVLLGAYVLGALPAEDRARLDLHAAGCETCRRELADYAVIPGMLAHTTPQRILEGITPPVDPCPIADSAGTPPATLAVTLQHLRTARRARQRHAVLAGAAALVLLGSGAALVVRHEGGQGVATALAQRALPLVAANRGGATGSAALARRPWGTELHLDMRNLPATQRLVAVVVSTDGQREDTATWMAPSGGVAHVTGATSIPESALDRIEVRTVSGALVLVTRENKRSGCCATSTPW